MLSSLDSNIREKLSSYLTGEISLHEFEDWFFPETWEVDQIEDFSLIRLVYGIKLRLAEFSNGDWTEDELQDRLRPFVEKYEVAVNTVLPQTQIQYGTSSITEPGIVYSYQAISVTVTDTSYCGL